MSQKLRVAVVFGGCSPEHDVSIVTGLQALQALDSERFAGIPVYITTDGAWLTGKALRDRSFYIPGPDARAAATALIGPYAAPGQSPTLRAVRNPLFGASRDVGFDVALLALHGGTGESGQIQGVFEMAGVPYTGMRPLGAAVAMDKIATKRLLQDAAIPLLPFAELRRPAGSRFLPRAELDQALARVGLPCILKPVHLGSSIGVVRIASADELEQVLPGIFGLDGVVMLEPYVRDLVEYNVSVGSFAGDIRTSAIETPKRVQDLLDFRQKYLSSPGKSGAKIAGQSSEGLLALTRTINPVLAPALEAQIRDHATRAFRLLGTAGVPRIDFLSNAASGELWLNEVNPCPGSFGFFLWEAASSPVLFTQLLAQQIEEAVGLHRAARQPADPVPEDARLFRRP
jgi:D-alanine-D-alanine ligase